MKMASSIPATNSLSMAAAVANNTNDAQMNFNPSWMQSTAPPMQRSLSISANNNTNSSKSGTSGSAASNVNAKKFVSENDETCEPIFAKHSYGREDLLAMMGKNTMKPPQGIKRCPFFVDTAQTPIILMPFTDTEMRLQQNMNSSKAMSSKKKPFNRIESTPKNTDIWPRRTAGVTSGGGGGVGSGTGVGGNSAGSGGGGVVRQQQSQTPPAATATVTTAPTAATQPQQHTYRGGGTANSPSNNATTTPTTNTATNNNNNNNNGTTAANTSTTTTANSTTTASNANAGIGANVATEKEAATTKFGEREANALAPMHKNGNTTGSGGVGSAMAKEPSSTHAQKKPSTAAAASAIGKGTPPPSSSASAPATTATTHYWCYLDPSGIQRGPFDTHQMQAWFSSGYFSETLQVRRKEETTYTTLGELFLVNGREAPFKVRTVAPAAPAQKSLQNQLQNTATATAFPSVQQRISPSDLIESITQHTHISPNLESVQRIWATTPLEEVAVGGAVGGGGGGTNIGTAASSVSAPSSNIGGGGGSSTIAAIGSGGIAGSTTASMTMLQNKELQILEEQRKLREKEELLRRDELERTEKERRMREMEAELKRHQEELGRRAREKDAEFEQRYAQMAEYERKRRDELAALEQRIRNEHLQRQLRLEEEDRRRANELEELLRREQERQHQLVEAEVKRKRDEEELRLRLAYQEKQHQQELIREKARRAEEEQRRRLIEQQQRQQQKALDEARAERAKEQAKADAAAAASANSFAFSQPVQPPRASAWQPIPTPPVLPIGQQFQQQSPPIHQFPPQQHNLPHNQQQQPAVTEQRRGWQQVQLPTPAPIPPAIGKQQPQDGGGTGAAVPKAGTGNSKKQQQQQQKKQAQQKQKKPEQQMPVVEDKFTAWIIKRVKALNPSVDAEVFATFISDIDSPNEAEDYIIGYLGETKDVKEFHRDFLQKRIELRPRAHQQAPKDDLSRPAAALGADSEQHHKGTGGWASATGGGVSATAANSAAATTTAANITAQHNINNSNNNKKKKGGPKGQKVLDASTLGFRPASDPNRVNAGEIDSVPPVPGGGGSNRKR